MTIIDHVHGGYVFKRRVHKLSDHLARVIPKEAHVLDVGCGDGLVDYLISQKRPDIDLSGVDVLVRPQTHISVSRFDGNVIPFADRNFDVVMFVDVLHHTEDPMILLREAIRVARNGIVIKDHTRNGLFANSTLRLMDRIGNARHGVALPYNYWPQKRWAEVIESLDLKQSEWMTDLGLYPWPASLVFDRGLHFIARLDIS